MLMSPSPVRCGSHLSLPPSPVGTPRPIGDVSLPVFLKFVGLMADSHSFPEETLPVLKASLGCSRIRPSCTHVAHWALPSSVYNRGDIHESLLHPVFSASLPSIPLPTSRRSQVLSSEYFHRGEENPTATHHHFFFPKSRPANSHRPCHLRQDVDPFFIHLDTISVGDQLHRTCGASRLPCIPSPYCSSLL